MGFKQHRVFGLVPEDDEAHGMTTLWVYKTTNCVFDKYKTRLCTYNEQPTDNRHSLNESLAYWVGLLAASSGSVMSLFAPVLKAHQLGCWGK
jgi:hypothetical protein